MQLPKLSLPRWQARERPPVPMDGEPLAWCVFLSLIGAALVAGSTWLLIVFIAGSVGHFDWFFDYRTGNEGAPKFDWYFESALHMPVAIGLALFCFGIACYNVIWWELRKRARSDGARRVYLGTGLFVALFMIAGATVVQQKGTEARDRDKLVAAQTADVAAVTAATRTSLAEAELKRLTNDSLTTYQAQAARDGAKAWQRRIDIARGIKDAQLPMIEKALASAERADELRAQLEAKVVAQEVAKVGAVTASATPAAEGWMARTTRAIEDLRKPATSILGEWLAILIVSSAIGAWFSRKPAEDVEPANVMMIEDHSAEAVPAAQPYTQATEKREQYYDEDGNKIVRRKATWAKVPTSKAKRKVPDGKGRMVDDTTDYEAPAPADKTRLNEEYGDGEPNDADAGRGEGAEVVSRVHVANGLSSAVAREPEVQTSPFAEQAPQDAPQAVAEMEDVGMENNGASISPAGDTALAAAHGDDGVDSADGGGALGDGANAADGEVLQQPSAVHSIPDEDLDRPEITLADETVAVLEAAEIIKDGDLPDQFIKDGALDEEAVREHMATERGLPAPRETEEAA